MNSSLNVETWQWLSELFKRIQTAIECSEINVFHTLTLFIFSAFRSLSLLKSFCAFRTTGHRHWLQIYLWYRSRVPTRAVFHTDRRKTHRQRLIPTNLLFVISTSKTSVAISVMCLKCGSFTIVDVPSQRTYTTSTCLATE